jgi:methanogenic corrinoid protein MtbC1
LLFGVRERSGRATEARRRQATGHSLDTLYVHFLEPTARYLGDLWAQDHCDFIDVPIGVARLQELLTLFSATIEVAFDDMHHHASLMSLTSEQYLFGVDMVTKFLRGAGWTVTAGERMSVDECVRAFKQEKFGVAGLTISSESACDAAARTIAAIRRASRNRAIGIMVGGPEFRENSSLAVQIGADATAPDAPSAVILAKKLLVTATIWC